MVVFLITVTSTVAGQRGHLIMVTSTVVGQRVYLTMVFLTVVTGMVVYLITVILIQSQYGTKGTSTTVISGAYAG